ncbi:MAG TPA: autotransporter-associated beta strand repeat-containing protein, partial [Prosthecobacter sp.]|nr:autotransporter-associated beta strand repeat-containing protein [Prosthecobacter sp.]
GTLILGSSGNAFTDIHFNQGAVQADALGKLGTGNLNFFGGSLKFGGVFDPTSKTITFGTGGGTFDTNGNNISLTGSFGNSGVGGFTKAGAGTLTVTAPAGYLGGTTVTGGTLALGISNGISGGALTVSGGGTFDLAAFTPTVSSLTLGAGAANAITGSGTLTVTGDATLNQGSIASVLAGSMNLFKQTASQTVSLTNSANTYTGFTQVANGTLSIMSVANAGTASPLGAPTGDNAAIRLGQGTTTGTLAIDAAGSAGSTNRTIDLVGTTGGGIIDNDGTAALTLTGGITSSTAGAKTITLSGAATGFNNVVASNITNGYGTVGLIKAEGGTWALSGTNTYTGNTAVNAGTLIISGSTNNGVGTASVGGVAGNSGVLRVGTGANYQTTTFAIGGVASGVGSLVVNGGSVATTTATVSVGINLGNLGYGGLFLSDGSISTHRIENNSASGTSVIQVSGGTLTSDEFIIFRNNRWEFTVTGGQVLHNAASAQIALGWDKAGTGVMTVAGGLVDNTAQTIIFGGGTTPATTSSINLNAGTLITNAMTRATGATGIVNFNGGTIRASLDGATFIPNTVSTYVNGAFGSFAGGAVFDTNGKNITVDASLSAPTGNGVSGLSVGSAGSGYIGAPYVEITGGGGTGATGYATVDLNPASPTFGQVTGIVLTNPGIGYTSAPTVTLMGGGGSGAAINVSGIVANTSGGLQKVGAGTLTLSGTNTFSGPVTVNGGILSVGATGLANISSLTVGATTTSRFDLYQDGIGAEWVMPSNANITLGGATTSGALGFNLGTASDRIVLSGTGELIINAGGGFINAVAVSGFDVGSYTVITGASAITGIGFLKLGTLPSGYQYSLGATASSITLNVLNVAPAGGLYWTGAVNNSWGGLNGSDSNWSTVPNGATDATYAPGPNNTVYFSATNASSAPFQTTLDSPVSVEGLKFLASNTGAVTIAPGIAGSLTVGTGGIELQAGTASPVAISAPLVLGAAQTWTVADAAATLDVSGVVSGSGNLIKAGAGTAILSGLNSFTGNVTLNAGTLRVTTAGTTGLGTGAAALFLNGGELQLANSTARNHARNTTIGGNVTITTDRLTAGAGVTHTLGTLSLGANAVTVQSGSLATSGNQGLTFGAGTLTGSPTFTVNNNGLGAVTVLTIGGFTESPADSGYGFTKNGNGLLILNGVGSYTGVVTLNAGALRVTADSTTGLGIGAATLLLNGGELQLFNTTGRNYGRNTTVAGDITITVNRNSAGAGVTHTLGTLDVGAQDVLVQAGSNATSGTMGLTFGATTLTGSPTFTVNNNGLGSTTALTLGATSLGAHDLTFNGTGNVSITGIVSGDGGILKQTTGSLTMGGVASTFTGGIFM